VRFGLLGTGYWAAETHAAALVAAPGTELAAVWGRDPAKAASVADRYGIRPYDDVDELIAAVDAVAIALPPQVQAPLAARAARAGKHLFLDKPLALTVAAADEVVAAVDATGVDSVVFFTSRFNPPAVDFLHHALATGGWDGGRATLLGTVVGTPYDASPWRHQYGGLWDVGPHALSLLIPVLGRITGVSAALGPHQTATALLTHESGAVSTMTLSLASPVTTWDVFLLRHVRLGLGAAGDRRGRGRGRRAGGAHRRRPLLRRPLRPRRHRRPRPRRRRPGAALTAQAGVREVVRPAYPGGAGLLDPRLKPAVIRPAGGAGRPG
jgi:predicted dehydrogenase